MLKFLCNTVCGRKLDHMALNSTTTGNLKQSCHEIFLFFFEASRYYCDEQRRRVEGSVQLQFDRQDGDPVVRLAGRRRSPSSPAGDHRGFKPKRHYADHGQVIKQPPKYAHRFFEHKSAK